MRIISSRFFLSALIMGIALGAPSLGLAEKAPKSAEEPELFFYPVEQWTVDKAPASCAISNQFNNGFVIRFEGSESEVQDLSIDFRQDVFKSGTSYDATITVPGISTQKIRAKGTSATTLSMGLNDFSSFYESLRTAAVLDVSVEKNSFRFYLTGFSKGAMNFEECLMGEQVSASSAAAPAQAQESQVQKKALASKDTDRFKVNEAVALEVETKKAPPVSQAKPPVEKPKKPESLELPVEPQKPAPKIARERLPEKIEFAKPKELTSIKEPLSAPKTEGTHASTPEMVVHTEKMSAKADFTKVGLEDENNAGRGANNNQTGDFEKEIASLKAENEALNKELKTMVKASEHERLSVSSDNWDLEQATMKFNEAERQIKRMGMELQKERAQCDAQKKDLEATLFDPQITNQAQLAHLADLEQQLAKAKADLESQRLVYEERLRQAAQQTNRP